MSLEKDIKQAKFRNEWQKVSINIIYSYNWMMNRFRIIYERGNITHQQYNILRILRGAGTPLSTMQIRERMLDKMSDTSRIVDRLVIKKLVSKTLNKADKRLVDVKITQAGLDLLAQLDNMAEDLDNIFKNLTEAEALQLNILLDKVRNGETL
jgi:DNA-binding MarR family transcriptional regulator